MKLRKDRDRKKKTEKKKQKKGGDKKGAVKKPSNQSVQSFDLHRKNRSFVFFVFFVFSSPFYSHSMVAGGLELMSYVTLLIPRTSLMILSGERGMEVGSSHGKTQKKIKQTTEVNRTAEKKIKMETNDP